MNPETFEQELHTRLGPQYRLRWSNLTSTWNIEHHMGRGVWDTPVNDWDDQAIRARDGYVLVCAIHPRPFMVCPECHNAISIPELTIGEVHCEYCERQTGRWITYFAGHYPLCDRLIERLERTSPKNHKQFRRELNEGNARRLAAKDKQMSDEMEDILADVYNRAMDRPQIGYGGSIKSTGQWTTT